MNNPPNRYENAFAKMRENYPVELVNFTDPTGGNTSLTIQV